MKRLAIVKYSIVEPQRHKEHRENNNSSIQFFFVSLNLCALCVSVVQQSLFLEDCYGK